jgi:hypothetical protein
MTVFLARPLVAAGLAAWIGVWAGAVGPAPAAEPEDGTALKIKEGQQAPEVELPATQVGSALPDRKEAPTLRLKDLQGKKNVVLYFFPKASTPG